jgi:hypothetical protein
MQPSTKQLRKSNKYEGIQNNGESISDFRRLPAMLADAEIAHLEAVASHLLNTGYRGLPGYLGAAYWIARVESVDKRFRLVLTQQRRLAALRATFSSVDQSDRGLDPQDRDLGNGGNR